MPRVIEAASAIPVAGGKQIHEYIGRVNSGTNDMSVAHMKSPMGWSEPGQRPEFREVTLVLAGCVHIEHEQGALDIRAGQAVVTDAGEWVRYSTPEAGGAEYVAICLPAFDFQAAHRDPE